jgi:DNA repair exonuclease SbcCD nuclease subunit
VYGVSFGRGDFATNLVQRFPPRGLTDGVAIGLCHATVGTRPDHAPWAPCTMDDLVGSGYDYWALGHVHTREVVRGASPAVVYPGNPQGRHRRESGPRGCALVELEGGQADVRFVDTDVVRWEPLEVTIDDLSDAEALGRRLLQEVDRLTDLAEGRSLAIALTLRGRGELHRLVASPSAVRALLADVETETSIGGRVVVVESVRTAVRPALDPAALRERASLAGEVLRVLDGPSSTAGTADDLFAPLESRLSEVSLGRTGPDPEADARVIRAADLAIDLLDEEEG